MIRIGKYFIATDNELRDIVVEGMPETIARHVATLINQDLLRACMAADALLHDHPARPTYEEHRKEVCNMLIEAIGPALKGVTACQ